MDCNTFITDLALPAQPVQIAPASLLAALRQLEDGRGKKGRRYRVEVVLTLLILAKLAGEHQIKRIAQWVRLRGEWLAAALQLPSGRLPCANTYRYVCQNIEVSQLNQILADFFTGPLSPSAPTSLEVDPPPPPSPPPPLPLLPPPRGSRHLAVDGKTLRGTLKAACQKQGGSVHLLELYALKEGVGGGVGPTSGS